MLKIVCPDCNDERLKYEVVNVAPVERRYEVRCPVCGKIFVVCAKDIKAIDGQPS
jgi:uncharacterized Zn finger protein